MRRLSRARARTRGKKPRNPDAVKTMLLERFGLEDGGHLGHLGAGDVAHRAKDAVAWAVKNEIFGGYTVLDPMGDITRAQMAKMAVAFQAEPLKEGARG